MTTEASAKLYRNRTISDKDTSVWTGIVKFGSKQRLMTAEIPTAVNEETSMFVEIHERRAGIRNAFRGKLDPFKQWQRDGDPHLFGVIYVLEKLYAVGCWMCREPDGRKCFTFQFVEIEDEMEPAKPALKRQPRARPLPLRAANARG